MKINNCLGDDFTVSCSILGAGIRTVNMSEGAHGVNMCYYGFCILVKVVNVLK